MGRLKKLYDEEIVPAMMKDFGYENRLVVPRLEKITLNVGMGEAIQNIKVLDVAVTELMKSTDGNVMPSSPRFNPNDLHSGDRLEPSLRPQGSFCRPEPGHCTCHTSA